MLNPPRISTSLLPLLILLLLPLPSNSHPSPDFLILGAGTAGCPLAARLCTLLPNAQITLLERSPARPKRLNLLIKSPRQALPLWLNPSVSSIFPSLPDPSTNNRSHLIVTGNTLGGSSAINGMQWTVPSPNSIHRWRIRGLNASSAHLFYHRAYRKVHFRPQPPHLRPIYTDAYLRAARRAGFRVRFTPFDNPLSHRQIWTQAAAIDTRGRRVDACTAYLEPVRHRCPNLRVAQGVTVTKILLSEGDKAGVRRARGVEYVDGEGRRAAMSARKEIFLTAGPYESPKLLMLSGIGPRSHLQRMGIPLKVDLGVGQRTQARGFGMVMSKYRGVPLAPVNNRTAVAKGADMREWMSGKGGVWGKSAFMTLGVVGNGGYAMSALALWDELLNVPGVWSICVGNAGGYGQLRLKDAHPSSMPEVKLNVLGGKGDTERLKRCVSEMMAVHEKLGDILGAEVVEPKVAVNDEYLRRTVNHAYHFVGGCRVGGVVRSNLKVKRVSGLRVVDSSVFKRLPTSAGPMASTYMLAEFVADKLGRMYRREFGKRAADEQRCASSHIWARQRQSPA